MDLVSSFIEKFSGLTEEYKFYNGEVTLRYQPEEHVYYLLKDNQLIPQAGVTSVVHIIDKSNALIPWAAKKVIEKLLLNVPVVTTPTEQKLINLPYEEFEKIALEAKSAPRDKLEEAADVGHMAHEWIESYIKHLLNTELPLKLLPIDERSANCCKAALKWMEAHNVRWIKTESKIYSRQYEYAGTMDGLALVDSCSDPNCCANGFLNRLSVIDWKSSNYLYIEYLLQTAAYVKAHLEEFPKEKITDRWVIRLGKTDGEFEPWHVGIETIEEDFDAFATALHLSRAVTSIEKRMNIHKEYFKEMKKKEKAAEKARAALIKCKSADKYKGIKYPTCNGGNPCSTCIAKYNERHPDSPIPMVTMKFVAGPITKDTSIKYIKAEDSIV